MKKVIIFILVIYYCSGIVFSQTTGLYKYTELVQVSELLNSATFQGIEYAKRGKLNGAYNSFLKARNRSIIDKKGGDTCIYNLGVICMLFHTKEKYSEGLNYFKKIKNPETFECFWENLTIAFIANNQLKEAKESLRNIDTTKSISHYLEAVLCIKEKKFVRANFLFKKAQKKGIDNLPLLPVALSRYKVRIDGNSQVLNEAKRLFSISRKNSQEEWYAATWGESITNAELGNTKRAIRLLDELKADSSVLYARGLIYFNAGEDSLAGIEFKSLLKQKPKFAHAYVGLGHLAVKAASVTDNQKQWLLALKYYSSAIKLDPNPAYYESRALCWLRLFDFRQSESDSCIVKAIEDFKSIHMIAPNWDFNYDTILAEAKSWHYIYYSLVFKMHKSRYFDIKKKDEYLDNAKNKYIFCINNDTTRNEAFEGLAALQLQTGANPMITLHNYQQAYNISRNETNSLGVGFTYFQIKNFPMAESFFREVLKINPNNASAIMGLGFIKLEEKITIPDGIALLQKSYELSRSDSDDITKACIAFNYAFAKTQSFESSQHELKKSQFETYLQEIIIPLYKEASKITPIADSMFYFTNIGRYAENIGFLNLRDYYYERSACWQAFNNKAIIKAEKKRISEAEKMFEQIKKYSKTVEENLLHLEREEINQLIKLNIIYLHVGFELGKIEPTISNHYFPNYNVLQPIENFYSFGKPEIIFKYSKVPAVVKKKNKGLECPK